MPKTSAIPQTDLHAIVRKEVVDVMREMLSDPDSGLELTAAFERKLKKSVKEKDGGRVTPLSELFT